MNKFLDENGLKYLLEKMKSSGSGIESIDYVSHEVVGDETLTTLCVRYSDGCTDEFTVHAQNGEQGKTGERGPQGEKGEQGGATAVSVSIGLGDWEEFQATVSVSGVTEENTVLVVAAPSSYYEYTQAGVYCCEQQNGALVFMCKNEPGTDLTVNVLIYD